MDAFHGAQAFNLFVLHTPDWQMFLGRSLFRLPGAQNVKLFGGMASYKGKQHLAKGPASGYIDFFSHDPIEPKTLGGEVMSFDELCAEAGLLLNAGNDTTATCLINTFYLFMKNPRVFRKLRSELDNVLTVDGRVAQWEIVNGLKYL